MLCDEADAGGVGGGEQLLYYCVMRLMEGYSTV